MLSEKQIAEHATFKSPTGGADVTAPVLSAAAVSGTDLSLNYNEALDAASVPAAARFTVLVNGVARTVSATGITGSTVTLTLATPVISTDTVTVSYTAAASPIRDVAANNAGNLAGQAVTNNTPAALTYATATNWAESNYLSGWTTFVETRRVNVTTQAQLETAIANALAGDYIDCTTNFAISRIIITKQVSGGVAKVNLHGCTFNGNGVAQIPAIWLNGCANLYFYGGDITNTASGGQGIIAYDADKIRWWDAYIHDTSGTAVLWEPKTRACAVDLRFVGYGCAKSTVGDPHAEPGTGIHFMYTGGGVDGPYPLRGRIALDVSYNKYGALMELNHLNACDIYIRGDHIGYDTGGTPWDSSVQVAGNAIQAWGDDPTGSNLQFNIRYIECANMRGRPFDATSVTADLSDCTIDYGRAATCCLNPNILTTSGLAGTTYWDQRHGAISKVNVVPAT